ncbi:hypothetical protein OAC89_00700 [Deltaproteobacteria bacterium]|nr:hypothetical protein [Deltaproteobacteria bacterium]
MLNKLLPAIYSVCFLFFVGCAPVLSNMQVSDLKNEENHRRNWSVNKSISEIKDIVEKYNFNCRPQPLPGVDPTNPKLARIRYYVDGLTDYSVIGLIEFFENESGTTTMIDAWFYYPTWNNRADDYKQIIENPDECLK